MYMLHLVLKINLLVTEARDSVSVEVASAGPYASLYLAPERQHDPNTQFWTEK